MRRVKYERHEFRGEPEKREATLDVFVYDIPYFGACGIFPPFHIINQILTTGGSEGGMGPGATWEPFQISKSEYDVLAEKIRALNPQTLGDTARYTWPPFAFDHSFDRIENWEKWLFAVCEKHRDAYHKKLERHPKQKDSK